MFVGVCRLTCRVAHAHSLKEKRRVLHSMREKVRAKFHVGMAEVGSQDLWQEIIVGFSFCAWNKADAEGRMDRIVDFVEEIGEATAWKTEREVLSYPLDNPFGASLGEMASNDRSWVPEDWLSDREGEP